MIRERNQEKLTVSRILVLGMSRPAFGSERATVESGTPRFRDPTNRERHFIALLLDDAEIKNVLKQSAHVE
jgi:hypothetical protein